MLSSVKDIDDVRILTRLPTLPEVTSRHTLVSLMANTCDVDDVISPYPPSNVSRQRNILLYHELCRSNGTRQPSTYCFAVDTQLQNMFSCNWLHRVITYSRYTLMTRIHGPVTVFN